MPHASFIVIIVIPCQPARFTISCATKLEFYSIRVDFSAKIMTQQAYFLVALLVIELFAIKSSALSRRPWLRRSFELQLNQIVLYMNGKHSTSNRRIETFYKIFSPLFNIPACFRL
jgi:hypothetical protein